MNIRRPVAAVLATAWLVLARSAPGQDAPSNSNLNLNSKPNPKSSAPAVKSPREVELEQRVERLEEMVRRLSNQVDRLSADKSSGNSAPEPIRSSTKPAGYAPISPRQARSARSNAAEDEPAHTVLDDDSSSIAGFSRFNMPAPERNLGLKTRFGPGFQMKSDDDEFSISFHNLTQFDGRFYQQGGQQPVHDTFSFAREWFIFNGHLTKPFEYYVSFANTFDSFNILDIFLDVHYDDRFIFRAGRFKSPFTYEFYAEPTQWLMNGEWSLFFNNFGINRDDGLMAYGKILDKRLEYAVGIFNGARNSFVDTHDAKDLISYLNYKPFANQEGSLLENLSIGGSVDTGDQANEPLPQVFRTVVPTTGNVVIGVPFLAFNNNVRELGNRTLWSLHSAWYHKGLSLVGEWQSGFDTYALANAPSSRTRLPVDGFYVQAGYFLTGETVSSRGAVKPLRPFDIRRGQLGPGAIEPAIRYNLLDISPEVFTRGLADPNNWTNRLYTTDIGVNWYWNEYIKVFLDWQHAEFGKPVVFAPGRRQHNSDLFWLRFQIYF